MATECVYYSDASYTTVHTPADASSEKAVYTRPKTEANTDWNKKGFRLPTEAEWEWAARGCVENESAKYAGTNDDAKLGDYAWYEDTPDVNSKTHEVGTRKANEYGLYDMSGNVWEWCWDWYGTLPSSMPKDFAGAVSGSHRVGRGASWLESAEICLVARRGCSAPSSAGGDLGFRLACLP